MADFYIVRRARKVLMLPLGGTKKRPNILIPLQGLSKSELDELVSAVLEKRGMEKEKSRILDLAEEGYEDRIKTAEASQELRKRIAEQAEFPHLKYGGLKPPRKRSQRRMI